MAKAKAKAKSKTKANAKSKVPTLPGGYKVIGRAPKWDMEKHPVIEGMRGEAKALVFTDPPAKKGGKPIKREVQVMVVTDETLGPVSVWESGGLRDLFEQTEDGDQVRIEFLGMGTKKPGQNAPRLFSCAKKD